MWISEQTDGLHFVQQAEKDLDPRWGSGGRSFTHFCFFGGALGARAHLTQLSIFFFDVHAIVKEAKVDSRVFQQPSRTYGAG